MDRLPPAEPMPCDGPPSRGMQAGLAYGALGLPLAFVSLPLYITLPHHHATQSGLPLAALGAVLLAVRAFDALLDPWIGRRVDRLFQDGPARAWRAAALCSLLLGLGFAALWRLPPGGIAFRLSWLAGLLMLCTVAYSGLTILHQAWGTRWAGPPARQAEIASWREGAALAGIVCASVLPGVLGQEGASVLMGLGLLLGLVGLRQLAPSASPPGAVAGGTTAAPWRSPAFRALLGVYALNGIAAALPATLFPFFVADRLNEATRQPLFLLAYFSAAALGLPLWIKLVKRHGLAPTWRLGMGLSVLAFASAAVLGPGQAKAFLGVCVASGLALGADLAIPSALLAGVIQQSGMSRQAEGSYLGWWACTTKLNLALAAGLALPLLALAGYRPGQADEAGLGALSMAYSAVPCALKLMAAAWLGHLMQRHLTWRTPS